MRFFAVTMTFGTRAMGRSTGRILISERVFSKPNMDAGKIVTKRPVVKSAVVSDSPQVRAGSARNSMFFTA